MNLDMLNTQNTMISHAKQLLSSAHNRLEEIYLLPVDQQNRALIQLGWDLSYAEGWIIGIENTFEDMEDSKLLT